MSTYFSHTPYEPGDSVAGIDTVITAVETALNDLPTEAVLDRVLGRQHFADGVRIVDNVLGGGYAAYTVEHSGSNHTYTVDTETITYNAYGDDGNTDRNPIGDTSDGGYTGGEAKIEFSIPATGAGERDHAPAVWVQANVQVANADESIRQVMIAVQVLEVDGLSFQWLTVDRTERFVSVEDHKISSEEMGIDVPIRTLIRASDLSDPSLLLGGVRLVVSAYSSAALVTGHKITLYRWNLTALPLRIKEE